MMRLLVALLLFPAVVFASDYSMQLTQIRVADLARIVYGDVLKRSFVLDDDVIQSADSVSLNWVDLNRGQVESMTRDLLQLRGFELQDHGAVLLVRKRAKEDDGVLVYSPRNRSAKYLSDVLLKVADAQRLGARPVQSSPQYSAQLQQSQEVVGAVSSTVDRSAYDQLAYSCSPSRCGQLRSILEQLDTPEAQVLLKAVLYEVGTTKGEGSALQAVADVLSGSSSLTVSAGSVISGAGQFHLVSGGLDAVVSLLDQDSRFKSVSRPMLRVRTGAQAKFSVGSSVPILGAITQDKNGNPVQSVEYKQSGTIFTVMPDIRQDVVDLNVTQELSNFVQTTTGVNNTPTLLQRTATSQLGIKPGEVVIFAGLEEQKEDEAHNRFLGFDIGKKANQSTVEVLLFIEAQRI